MSEERLQAELALVRAHYPALEFRDQDLWARLPAYPLPTSEWGPDNVEVAFRFPRDTLGEEPYGFWVRPPLKLPGGGNPTNASEATVATGFGEGYQQFSWAPDGWRPAPVVLCGTNMLDWVRSFRKRLAQVG